MKMDSPGVQAASPELPSPPNPQKAKVPRPQTAVIRRKPASDFQVPVASVEVSNPVPKPQRPQSAFPGKLSSTAKGTFELSNNKDEPLVDWQRLFRISGEGKETSTRLMALSKTQLGSRFPGSSSMMQSATSSRPASAQVRLRGNRSINPSAELAETIKRRFKPPVMLNGYSLLQAMAVTEPYLLGKGLKSESNSMSERDLIGIAKSKSIETFFRVLTGKPETRMKFSKPPLAKPWFSGLRRKGTSSLLDGFLYLESHTKEEQDAKTVMDNLHKKFTHAEVTETISQVTSNRHLPEEGQQQPGFSFPELERIAEKPIVQEKPLEVVGVSTARIRPASASILRFPAKQKREMDSGKKVEFSKGEETGIASVPVGSEEASPSSLVVTPAPRWQQVKVKSFELETPEPDRKQYVNSLSSKMLRNHIVSRHSTTQGLSGARRAV